MNQSASHSFLHACAGVGLVSKKFLLKQAKHWTSRLTTHDGDAFVAARFKGCSLTALLQPTFFCKYNPSKELESRDKETHFTAASFG